MVMSVSHDIGREGIIVRKFLVMSTLSNRHSQCAASVLLRALRPYL
jgi:hypothetical protein